MTKIEIPLTGYAHETFKVLGNMGCLLVSGTMEKANAMTIGWGLIGMLWGKPVFMVAVRPSRHTFKLLEETGEFTVNVPTKEMGEVLGYCGRISGRDEDKIKTRGLATEEGKFVNTPILPDCAVTYECRVIFKTEILSEKIPEDEAQKWYPNGDYHTIYFGEILSTVADQDAESQMPLE